MRYYFIRSVPLLVGVEAETEQDAWIAAGRRVDDFMVDAMDMVPRWNHEIDDDKEHTNDYIIEYQGDAIYAREVVERLKEDE